MSININDIYILHYLINNELLNYKNTTKYQSYIVDIHVAFHIKDSINYNAITTNNFEIYDKLITDTNQVEHSVEIFKNLIKNFDINKMEPLKIFYNNKIGKYIVFDGVHRLSILLFKNLIKDEIPLKYLNIINI